MLRLSSLTDPRARRLLSALDEAYFQFTSSLPSFLGDLAISEEIIYGGQGQGDFKGPSTLNPLITCSPWLFWEAFQSLDDGLFTRIAAAGMFISLSSVMLDHLVDDQMPHPALAVLLQQAVHQQGISLFRQVFPADSAFWKSFDSYSREYLAALGLEQQAQQLKLALTLDQFEASAGGKVLPMLTTITALSLATSQTNLLNPIDASFRASYIAGQLHDDLLDWRSDLQKGHLTYTLTTLLPAHPWQGGSLPSLPELENQVEITRSDLAAFNQVLTCFDRALAAVEGITCPAWISYLQEYRSIAEQHQRACVARHLQLALFKK